MVLVLILLLLIAFWVLHKKRKARRNSGELFYTKPEYRKEAPYKTTHGKSDYYRYNQRKSEEYRSPEVQEANQYFKNAARELRKCVVRLKPYDKIAVDPPFSSDEVVFLPVEGTFNMRFFTRLYLLRKHAVENCIVSQFGYIQYQIPVNIKNSELILLVYGPHYFKTLDELPMFTTIGESRCTDTDKLLYSKHSLFRIPKDVETFTDSLDSTINYNILSGYCEYKKTLEMLEKWIDDNFKRAKEEYQNTFGKEIIWKSEYRLFHFLSLLFPDAIYQYRAPWLAGQSLDIFLPSDKIGIEYQGQQHFEAVDYFGGKAHFQITQELDNKKRVKCEENGIRLLYWPYQNKIVYVSIASLLNISRNYTRKALLASVPFSVSDLLRPRDTFVSRPIAQTNEDTKPTFAIRKYTPDGVFVSEYESIQKAAADSESSATSIYKCINKERKISGGYCWQRELSSSEPQFIPTEANDTAVQTPNLGIARAVAQIDPATGEVMAVYDSISKAASAAGINAKGITDVLRKRQRTAAGYYWVYYTE